MVNYWEPYGNPRGEKKMREGDVNYRNLVITI
jgi:hypothetical protein